jgi:hypothetical protein
MPAEAIARALIRRGFLSETAARRALGRQRIYGGGIDTVLLEQGAIDERTLVEQLASIVGIPLAPETLLDTFVPMDPAPVALDFALRLGIAPLAMYDDALHVAVRPEHPHEELVRWAAQERILVEPFLLCEARYRVLLRAIYDAPIPPRHVTLLARLLGPQGARIATRHKADAARPHPPLDPLETLLGVARWGDETSRHQAIRMLANRAHDPRVAAYRRALVRKATGTDPAIACGAIHALAELRDEQAVPALILLLDSPNECVVSSAHTALRTLTCEDLGKRSKRWKTWWEAAGYRERAEWLFQGLAHKEPELRLLASQEMQALSGEYFGYHFDLPEREREEARQRFMAWWRQEHPRQNTRFPEG